jgi:hypothetical protein
MPVPTPNKTRNPVQRIPYKKASDVVPEFNWFKGMVIGDYGSGKSAFGTTFPTPGFVFDFDKGASLFRNTEFNYEQFDTSPKGWIDFEKMFNQVRRDVAEGMFKTVILDSTSTMTDCAMTRAMQMDPSRTNEGGPVWNIHYQIVKNLVQPKLQILKDFNCNVLLISHWKLNIDNKTGNILGAEPLLTGDLAKKVPGYFDEVYAAVVKPVAGKEEFILRLVSRSYYKARSRLCGMEGLLPKEIPNNYNTLMSEYQKALEKQQTKKEN